VQKLKPEEDSLTTTKAIAQREGILGFWRGVVPALILVSNPIITWVVFEQMKKLLLLRRSGSNTLLQRKEILVLSASSKLASMIATFPYIVVKSRLQVQGSQTSAPAYTGTLDCLRSIISSEGIPGLFKGFTSKVVSSVLAAVVLFLVHSEALSLAKWLRPRKLR
jgi:adenine nucleotide transporter 17